MNKDEVKKVKDAVSDDQPGMKDIPGIGPKTARKLLEEKKSIKNVNC